MAFISRYLDLLYPPRCVSCGSAQDWWCEECREAVEMLPQDPCARCLALDHAAEICDGVLPFSGVVATGFYHSPPLRRLVGSLKFDGITASARAVEVYLQDVVTRRTRPFPWAEEVSVLIHPMPLASGREHTRGFNQAVWLAERFRTAWNIRGEVANLLIRARGGMAQADVEHDARLRQVNVRGQFRAVSRLDRPVLLIDDVVTTGSTAAEAAQALLQAGAPRVYLLAMAVGR